MKNIAKLATLLTVLNSCIDSSPITDPVDVTSDNTSSSTMTKLPIATGTYKFQGSFEDMFPYPLTTLADAAGSVTNSDLITSVTVDDFIYFIAITSVDESVENAEVAKGFAVSFSFSTSTSTNHGFWGSASISGQEFDIDSLKLKLNTRSTEVNEIDELVVGYIDINCLVCCCEPFPTLFLAQGNSSNEVILIDEDRESVGIFIKDANIQFPSELRCQKNPNRCGYVE